MAVNPQISLLLDIYGSMLTPKERDALELYYNEDLSLREIADNERAERASRMDEGERATISRQGVRDAIKRAEAKLFDMEAYAAALFCRTHGFGDQVRAL